MQFTSLDEYVEALRNTEDPDILDSKLKTGDNYGIIFFGDGKEIFDKLSKIGSPWVQKKDEPGRVLFYYDSGSVIMNLFQVGGRWTDPEHQIEGQLFSAHCMFQPYQGSSMYPDGKRMPDVSCGKAMALAIADFLDYVKAEGYTFRLPEVNINHIPD